LLLALLQRRALQAWLRRQASLALRQQPALQVLRE